MSTKWTLASNTTSGDRLSNLIKSAIQLSTGDTVMLVRDPSTADNGKVSLYLVPGTAHTTPSVIYTLNTTASGGGGVFANDLPILLCRDSLDNLYIAGAPSSGGNTTFQAFNKGAGLTWTAQAPVAPNHTSGGLPIYMFAFFSGITNHMTWSNTGGGSSGLGHLMLLMGAGGGGPVIFTIDAGLLLQGIWNGSTWSSASTGVTTVNEGSWAVEISPNGFGVTSGLYISEGPDSTHLYIGTWSVTSGGVPTMATPASVLVGTLTSATQARLVNVKSNRWAFCHRSSPNAGQITIDYRDQNAAQLSTADSGTASNFPAPGATLSWDAITANGALYVLGWSSLTATTLLAAQVTFPSDVVTIGSTATVDTAVGSGTNTTIRAVKEPIDTGHADIQTYNTTSPFSLLGDFYAIPATMSVPTLLTPTSGTVADLASGYTFTWKPNPATLTDTQASFAFQRVAAGGAPQWWTGSAWQNTEIFITSATASLTFAAANWTRNTTYTWSIAVKGGNGVSSGYATPWTVLSSAALPTTPTLTATYDSANNRVSLVVAGTGTDTAEFQVSRDGGTTWADVRGAGAVVLVAGAATVYDYEAQPGLASKYRVAQKDTSQGVYAINSAWSTIQTVTPSLTTFWLRNPSDGTIGMAVNVLEGSWSTQITENLAVHYPLGATKPIVLADQLKGEDGKCVFFTLTNTDETNLKALMSQQNTLLLMASDNRQWYIRVSAPRQRNIPQGTGASLRKEWAVQWVEVAQP